MKMLYTPTQMGKRKEERRRLMQVVKREGPHNTAEGSEYLDDAIRMVDQPLVNTNNKANIPADCMEYVR